MQDKRDEGEPKWVAEAVVEGGAVHTGDYRKYYKKGYSYSKTVCISSLVRAAKNAHLDRMKHMWWFLIVLFLLMVSRLFLVEEGFEVDPTFQEKYKKFVQFYNTFMTSWEKAIVTMVSMDAPPPAELSSPSQIDTSSKPKTPSRAQLNQYVQVLLTKEKKPFPPITDPLPEIITSLPTNLPSDPQPYINALDWMNEHMASSQKELESSMKGVEPYEDCSQINQCLSDPQNVAKITEAQQKQELQRQQTAGTILDRFNDNPALQSALATNQELTKKAEEIQHQAQSGKMVNNTKFPSEPKVKYTLPEGANKFKDMEKNDPAKYASYSKQYPQQASQKQLLDQINGNL